MERKMNKIKKFSRNKKGVSSLFITIFITLLAVILISTIFVGLTISRSSLTQYLRIEQERLQESVKLRGPGMEFLPYNPDIVKSLRVQNDGAIPIRIRGLYIDQEFICDPSEAQDTYIQPGKEKWIDLTYVHPNLPISLIDYDPEALWTVSTERSVKSSETAINLQYGEPGETTIPEFYIGPFMLFFDRFNWKSENGVWESGWTIPNTAEDVTWSILIRNIDQRGISLNDTSFFTLVGNENIPNSELEWYIDTDLTNRTFEPGDYHYIQFNRNNVGKEVGIYSQWTSCINFLVLTGYYDDETPFGQTIPFEAVLIIPEPELALTANPTTINMESESTITVTLTDSNGIAIPNALVKLSTNLGSVTAHAITNLEGKAEATFTAGTESGKATITARSQGTEASTAVTISK
jgi:hypothetical protein